MVGVQNSEVECPKCKGNYGFTEFQTRTQEEWFSCERCGYHLSYEIKEEDRKNKKLLKDCEFEKKESGGIGGV